MIAGPTRAGRDRTVELVRRGYEFTRWLRPGTGPARFRLAGRSALLVAGPNGVRTFYGTGELRRHRAVPLPIRGILLGPGAVHGLDGADHRHRRAVFHRVLTPVQISRLVELADQEWDRAISGWQSAGTGIVFDTAVQVYSAAVQRWAGLPTVTDRMTAEMARIVDGFGVPGPAMLRALVARVRCQRWARQLIRQVRRARARMQPHTPVEIIAFTTDAQGYPLPLRTAATELLNLLRPTVAVAWPAAFGVLALHRSPQWLGRLADEPDPADGAPAGPVAWACAHETRRWAPFVSLLAATATADVDLPQGRVRRGHRLLLDVHGTNHDPTCWPDPNTFDPGRFLPDDTAAHSDAFVAQGGGDPDRGHRCPGEPVTVELLAHTLQRISRLPHSLIPGQDLSAPLRRMPTRPASGVRLHLPRGTHPLPKQLSRQ